ncbi:MAG: ABC transporter permease subunit [Gemmataceae bacterium]|nr:ABC transporter permease subunit [Gemmataceae bacterium]
MRWPVVRLIAAREFRDQLRDRRTLFMILGLPVLMYPLFVGVGVMFMTILKDKRLVIGVVGADALPQPPGGGTPDPKAYPPLFAGDRFADKYVADGPAPDDPESAAGGALVVKPLDAADEGLLASREVDAIVAFDPDTAAKLERGEKAAVRVLGRDGEENSKLAVRRVTAVLRKWAEDVKAAKFARAGLPPDYDRPVEVQDPQSRKSAEKKIADEIRDALVKAIPLLLVMWVLTGAIHPAIDMTAGEKERGTMETLLISPAERGEIVLGKFLAVTALGFGTGVWNVFLMVVAVGVGQFFFPYPLLSLGGLAAGVLAALPLAALFAACCLSLGVFARSTKEGNYYIVPLFFLVLPLAYWSMAPGIELDGRMSWVPVTNACLLQQRLMAVRPDPFPWVHVPAVVISLTGCIGLALWAAVRQFNRESVLFREADAGGRKRGWKVFGRKSQDPTP